MNNNFAIRIAQLDYLRARIDADEGLNNLRYSVGGVIRLGAR